MTAAHPMVEPGELHVLIAWAVGIAVWTIAGGVALGRWAGKRWTA